MTVVDKTANTLRYGLLALAIALAWLFSAAAIADTTIAPPMRFKHLSTEDGLAQASVMAIAQDDRGFLWFATENGINRYDGLEFLHFQFDLGDTDSLPADYATDIVTTSTGELWIATDGGGIAKWNAATASFERVTRQNGLSDDKVQKLLADPRGFLWIGTLRDGLNRFDPTTGNVTVFQHDPNDPASLSANSVRALHLDADGTLWVGTNGGLDRISADGSRVTRIASADSVGARIAGNRVRTVLRDSHGDLWVGTQRGGLSRSQDDARSFTHYVSDGADGAISNNRIEALLEDDAGRLWVATADGLNLFLPRENGFAAYRTVANDPRSLSDNNVVSLFQDRGGLLWIGTKTRGVNQWNPRTWAFGHVLPEIIDNQRVRHVTSFADASNDGIWFGSFGGGLTRLDRDNRRTANIGKDNPIGRRLDDDRVMALAGNNATLWIGTMTGGLSKLDTASGSMTTYRADADDPTSLGADGVMSLYIDSSERLWVGTFGGGVDMLRPDGEAFEHFVHDAKDVTTLASPRATAIAEDQAGNIWVGTDGGGLHRLNGDGRSWTRFSADAGATGGFFGKTIYALHVDQRGELWVGTREGLYRTSSPGAVRPRFQVYDERSGLADDSVYGIRSDARQRVWFSTNRGLSVLEPTDGTVTNYSVSHGLQAYEFNFGAHFVAADGRLLFGGPNGFNAFSAGSTDFTAAPPQIALTGLELLNKPVRESAVYDDVRRVDLAYTDDVVTFEFAALDFAAPEQNRFQYKLEGFDREWVDAGGQHRTTYTNLRGGQYAFKVKAANSDGIWSTQSFDLDVRVEPPPWLTPWAYLLYAATALGIAFAIWQAQERRLRQRAEYSHQLELKVEERTREIAARNHELERANTALHEASYTDPLTGLRNRRYFFEQVGKQLDRVANRPSTERRSTPDEFVFMMIDLDHFKPVNDTHGHQAGDQLLVGVADALRDLCRSTDTVIRWGGDEFLLVAQRAGADEASYLAERVRSAVASSVFPVGQGHVARTTSSIGYASFPFFDNDPHRLTWEQTLKVADIVMYRAKEERNSWCGVVGIDYPHDVDTLLEAMHQDLDDLHEQGHVIVTEAVRDSSEKIA
ncbi:MAG: two-component regulator propeller domain-containing protein [Pseudomonadota bacterium]